MSLRDETIDLRLKGEPKEPRLVRLMAPIKLSGWLADPELGVDLGSAARQTGAAAVQRFAEAFFGPPGRIGRAQRP